MPQKSKFFGTDVGVDEGWMLHERKCKVCGRDFCIASVEQWAYKIRKSRDEILLVCSWRCLRKLEKENEEKEAAARAVKAMSAGQKSVMVRRLVLKGMSDSEIARETGMRAQLVHYYRRKIMEEWKE